MRKNYYWHNGEIKVGEPETNLYENSIVIYEVLRIVQGIPLFYEEHMDRFANSCNRLEVSELPQGDLLPSIMELSVKNQISEGNAMVKWIVDAGKVDVFIRFIPHTYPSKQQYLSGVDVGLLHAERNIPEAKFIQQTVRTLANRMISEESVYEVLLVNHLNQLTEGSRSNFIFIKDETLHIPPFNQILKGITLKKILKIAHQLGLRIQCAPIALKDLNHFNAVCMTGTSPKVLPVARIEKYTYDTGNKVVRDLMRKYELEIDQYLHQR